MGIDRQITRRQHQRQVDRLGVRTDIDDVIDQIHRIAVQDKRTGRGIEIDPAELGVRRQIIRVVQPGMAVEDELLTGQRDHPARPVGRRIPEIIDGAPHPAKPVGARDAQSDPPAAEIEPVDPVPRLVGNRQQIGVRAGLGAVVLDQLVAAQQIERRRGIGLIQTQHAPIDSQAVQVGDEDLVKAPRAGAEVQRELTVGRQGQRRSTDGADAVAAGRNRSPAVNGDRAQGCTAAQRRIGHDQHAARDVERTIHRQRPVADGRRAGVGLRARQRQRARAEFGQAAVPTQHAAVGSVGIVRANTECHTGRTIGQTKIARPRQTAKVGTRDSEHNVVGHGRGADRAILHRVGVTDDQLPAVEHRQSGVGVGILQVQCPGAVGKVRPRTRNHGGDRQGSVRRENPTAIDHLNHVADRAEPAECALVGQRGALQQSPLQD